MASPVPLRYTSTSRPTQHLVQLVRPTLSNPSYKLTKTPYSGDSLSTTGFNITGPLPNTLNPLGNPPFPGVTEVGGENWVGFATASFNNTVVLTYNFANSNATIARATLTPTSSSAQPYVTSLVDQVDLFLSSVGNASESAPWTSANALFSIWMGSQDISLGFNTQQDQSSSSDTLIATYCTQVERLYNSGARNFLFANIPPLDRSPAMLNQSSTTQSLFKSSIDTFNLNLQARLASFQSAHNDIQTFLWDTNAQIANILDNPLYFEIQDITSS
ncbi:Acetylesterase [Psilocybe cubensis]|uniref:Acetylesterase n=1 Tax=Psilocybe cubensis TaxID=181762 RepID=A0ACB8HDN1_PSICU|nr:Acetylesterase [Psilocybe cubensis]KAH9485986.1 Acetylesterase [Psilocybe cubensis]